MENSFENASIGDITLSPFAVSTPVKRPNKSWRTSASRGTFKKPVVPRKKGVVIATCSKCHKEYCTLTYYRKHLQSHTLKDAAQKFIDVEALKNSVKSIAHQVVQNLGGKRCVGKWGHQYNELVFTMLEHEDSEEWEAFVVFVGEQFSTQLDGKSVTLQSAMITSALKDVERLTGDSDLFQKCVDLISGIPHKCDPLVINFFLCDFIFNFCDEFLIFTSKTIRGNIEERDAVIAGVPISQEERQTIHYIAGSCIKGFIKYGRRFPKNQSWKDILCAIREKIVENPEIGAALEEDRVWTEILNRGALTFVGKDALNFFVSLARTLKGIEFIINRILSHDKILEAVFTGDAKYEWDSIIGNCMSEDASLNFMKCVTRSFTHTYGRGVAAKRINQSCKNTAHTSVTLRHGVAPRN